MMISYHWSNRVGDPLSLSCQNMHALGLRHSNGKIQAIGMLAYTKQMMFCGLALVHALFASSK